MSRTPLDQLGEYNSGDILVAADVNALIRAAKRQLAGMGSNAEGDEEALGYLGQRAICLNEVQYKNASGSTVPLGGVMKPGAQVTNSGVIALSITKPDSTYVWKYLISISKDVPDGGYGWGKWMMQYEYWANQFILMSDASDTSRSWGPKASAWDLWPKRPGFFFLECLDTTNKYGRFVQQIPAEILVYNDTGSSVAAAGGPTTLKMFGGTRGSEADLGLTVSPYNRTSVALANNKYGAVALLNGEEYLVPLQT
jgi:hypothetical protein